MQKKKTRTKRDKAISSAAQTIAPKRTRRSQEERFKEYLSPEFTQRLAENMQRAIKTALSGAKE
jgi:hypothetical protein